MSGNEPDRQGLTQSQRQPGSALKPLTFLAALQKGLQLTCEAWDRCQAAHEQLDRDGLTVPHGEGGAL
jgi:membrane carboxypeptidase/penicillin-binding protein